MKELGRIDWTQANVAITGAAHGIGAATARRASQRGARLFLSDIDEVPLKDTAERLRAFGAEVHTMVVDVRDPEHIAGWAQSMAARGTPATVLVNNAGLGMSGDFFDTTEADWDDVIDINLRGVITGMRLFGQQMRELDGPTAIVNIASGFGVVPSAEEPAYCVTKAGVVMLTQATRAEFADHDIGLSVILPGIINTGIDTRAAFVGAAAESNRAAIARKIFARRGYGPRRVADAILDAVDRNRPVVSVTPEAKLGRFIAHVAPPLMRRITAIRPF